MMYFDEDRTYNDIREKALNQWLSMMEEHSDLEVRGGVKLCREYLKHLEDEIRKLQKENELKNEYLKKMKNK